jgi:hypothetical protein
MDYNYKTGFCGSDCVLSTSPVAFVGSATRSRHVGSNISRTSAIPPLTTTNKPSNGFPLNGHCLGNRTAPAPQPLDLNLDLTIRKTNGTVVGTGTGTTRVRPGRRKTYGPPQLSYYKDLNGIRKPRKGPPTQEVRESFEQCSLLDALYTYLCYTVLVLVGYVNDILRPRASTEKFRMVWENSVKSYKNLPVI